MIKISADSTCDLSKEIIEANDITIVPLGVVVDGECFHDGVDITPAQLFDYVEKEKKQCSTTAVNVFEYKFKLSQYIGLVATLIITLSLSILCSIIFGNSSHKTSILSICSNVKSINSSIK